MSQIVDRRLNGKNKSAVNRQRFIRRFKRQIKKAVSDAIAKRSITDVDAGETITIPSEDTSEPIFHHDTGGKREMIHPGNKDFVTGDKIPRPPSGGGQGGGGNASNQGEGEDEFVFQISREEFLELFFEDLALPDLVKKELANMDNFQYHRAGFTTEGVPANISIARSLRSSLGRRVALSNPHKRRLAELEAELQQLKNDAKNTPSELESDDPIRKKITLLEEEITHCKQRIKAVPFLDPFDLRYNHRVKKAEPTTSAVMFCLMDVSGSMDEPKKDIAKRFFILLYLFLKRNYEKIDLVFIRHHTSAKEVSEEEFFYSRETGGTVVSSALELLRDIIKERYPQNAWNIYVAQASDGDNWNADSPYCQELLQNHIMPAVQYFSYVEIMPRHHQSLWEAYQEVTNTCPNFAMQVISEVNEIYPVFRELFKRQSA